MPQYRKNELRTLKRVVGNLEDIGATLLDQDGAAVNLTGLTLVFRMVLESDATVKINNSSADIVVAASGTCKYSPASGDMDTAGLYDCYFIDDAAVDRRFPYDGATFRLDLVAENSR